ncbi:unnamed protein product [Gongylonema pulchrum]|uniref:Uncharacterized protein n=1 Tax=Gongylonema pulchrum TaxID=637853 RepID=A0A183CU96_9BILA|nr:unnamed protein product [Gongylonema pulchrum]
MKALLPLALFVLPGVFSEGRERFSSKVSSKVTLLMTPMVTTKGNYTFESHASNLEEVNFVLAPEGKALKHPNLTFAIRITRKTCKAIKLCFGFKNILADHYKILTKVKLGDKTYDWKISREVYAMQSRDAYEIDACQALNDRSYRSKMTGISNMETIILHNEPSGDRPKLGLEVRHGPTLLRESVDKTTPAYTTFYENKDLWSEKKQVFFLLAQDANLCGARIWVIPRRSLLVELCEAQLLPVPFLRFRARRGVNIWSIPIGFIAGTLFGVAGGAFLLCRNTQKYYKRWNAEMKKTFGKFATGEISTVRPKAFDYLLF